MSQISQSQRHNPKGNYQDGPFAAHVGADGTAIWAAATSGADAIPVLMLACMLARIWSGPEATSLWVELIAHRRHEIETKFAHDQAAVFAAQQDLPRTQIADWDASARAWLRTADEVKSLQQTQLMLVINNLKLPVSNNMNVYQSVIQSAHSALSSVQNLLTGQPQRAQSGAFLLGLSAWHLYPDLVVHGRTTQRVNQKDDLFPVNSIVTLGLESPKGIDAGVFWSLPLAHLRYYGDPILSSSSTGHDASRISMDQFIYVALGSLFSGWVEKSQATRKLLSWFGLLSRCFKQDAGNNEIGMLTTCENHPRNIVGGCGWLKILLEAADAFPVMGERQRALSAKLMALGYRRFGSFLADDEQRLPPCFGLLRLSRLLLVLRNDEDRVNVLRRHAIRLGLDGSRVFIRYRRTNPHDFSIGQTDISQKQRKEIWNMTSSKTHSEFMYLSDYEYATALPIARDPAIIHGIASHNTSPRHRRWVATRWALTSNGSDKVPGDNLHVDENETISSDRLSTDENEWFSSDREQTYGNGVLRNRRQLYENNGDLEDTLKTLQETLGKFEETSSDGTETDGDCTYHYQGGETGDLLRRLRKSRFAVCHCINGCTASCLCRDFDDGCTSECSCSSMLHPCDTNQTPSTRMKTLARRLSTIRALNEDCIEERPRLFVDQYKPTPLRMLIGEAYRSIRRKYMKMWGSSQMSWTWRLKDSPWDVQNNESGGEPSAVQLLCGNPDTAALYLINKPTDILDDHYEDDFISFEDLRAVFEEGAVSPVRLAEYLLAFGQGRYESCVRSLKALASAKRIYDRLPEATVALKTASKPLYKSMWVKSSGKHRAATRARPKYSRRLRASNADPWLCDLSPASAFACIAMFESGTYDIDPRVLEHVFAISSGNSIFVAAPLLDDPSRGCREICITRIVGNIGRAGVALLIPPQATRVRKPELENWEVVNHAPFDGQCTDSFQNTTHHLSFTQYTMPCDIGKHGAQDVEAFFIESLVSVYDCEKWVADLDVLDLFRNPKFDRVDCPSESCNHFPGEVPEVGIKAIDNWEELLDREDWPVVVRTYRNPVARLATATVSAKQGYRTMLVSEKVCWHCIVSILPLDDGITFIQ